MYSLSGYGKMIADVQRMDAYVRALRQVVKQGSVVVDLGSGPGFFALLACQLGARRVYAIEPDNVIEVARQAAAANGYTERLICIQDYAANVTLPEQADIIISDLRGILPWFQTHLPSIADARKRLLKAEGILIPQRDTLWAALVEAPEQYQEIVGPWEDNEYGLDLTPALRFVTNTWRKVRVTPEQLLVEPSQWCVVDYTQEVEPNITADLSWTTKQTGTAHGLLVWFDSELFEGIGFSNNPGNTELVYGNAFFPLSYPVELKAGDEIAVKLSANLVGEDYIWRWNTRLVSEENAGSPTSFKQSTFLGAPLTADRLHKQSAHYAPLLNDEGVIKQFILMRMDGETRIEDIARSLKERFPGRFADWTDALNLVGEISVKYSH